MTGFYDVEILGTGFDADSTSVTIDKVECPIVGKVTYGKIVCTVPTHVRI